MNLKTIWCLWCNQSLVLQGRTTLHQAAKSGSSKTVQMLIDSGVKMDAMDYRVSCLSAYASLLLLPTIV